MITTYAARITSGAVDIQKYDTAPGMSAQSGWGWRTFPLSTGGSVSQAYVEELLNVNGYRTSGPWVAHTVVGVTSYIAPVEVI